MYQTALYPRYRLIRPLAKEENTNTTPDASWSDMVHIIVQTLLVITIYLVTALTLAGLSIVLEEFVHLW